MDNLLFAILPPLLMAERRQSALRDKAVEMGWPSSQVKVLDGDLGLSGTHMNKREDFKLLVAEVSMQRVGAVLALEASRLSRSCADWHRLPDPQNQETWQEPAAGKCSNAVTNVLPCVR